MKERIKNICKKIIKYPATIWMLASVIAFSAVYVGFAAYNGTAEVKRVVSTQASSTTVFSSNYLEAYSTAVSVKNLRTTTEGNFPVTITVCNYDQMGFNSYAKGLISYVLKAELVEYNSATNTYVPVNSVQKEGERAKTFYIKKTMDDNNAVEGTEQNLNTGSFAYTYSSETLTGGNPYKDSFEICFDAADVAKAVPSLFIRVTATPTADSQQLNTGITELSSIISISQGRSVETGWHGALQETADRDYDGYNLVIEGSGAGTIDICWDDRKFAMNPYFAELYGGNDGILGDAEPDGREGWMKRTLTVNSMTDNRYLVQFYKKDSYTGTEFPSKYIECKNYSAAEVVEDEPQP